MGTPQVGLQLGVLLVALLVLAWPLGIWFSAVAEGRIPRWLKPIAAFEKLLYRAAGVDPAEGSSWKRYALAAIAFNVLGVLVVYALQRLQGVLPLNPQHFTAVSPDSAFNTAVSFVTNTNWQGYGGESTMSQLTQMLALAVQNFFSAATGIAVVWALARGFVARSSAQIGSFWVDVTRSTLYVLLPLSVVFAIFLVGQGVVQNFDAAREVTTLEVNAWQQPKNGPDSQPLKDAKGNPVLEDVKAPTQSIAMGPVASQEAIKMLGTNGGGFFNANSAHPFENPTPLSNFAQMLSIFLIPAALVFGFG
ncbi:MAG: potassium-transporting ATPase subunit KdpA, partial [Caldimonas sp.]